MVDEIQRRSGCLSLAATLEPEPEPELGVSEGVPPFASTREWLADINLEMYHAALDELGYGEDIQMIIDGDDEEVQDMIGAVQDMIVAVGGVAEVKKAHLKKFKRELAKQFP